MLSDFVMGGERTFCSYEAYHRLTQSCDTCVLEESIEIRFELLFHRNRQHLILTPLKGCQLTCCFSREWLNLCLIVFRLVSSGSRYPAAFNPSKKADLESGCASSSLVAVGGILREGVVRRTSGFERFEET